MIQKVTITYTLEDSCLKRARITDNNTPMDDVSALRFVAQETIKGLDRIDQEIVSKAAEIINSGRG